MIRNESEKRIDLKKKDMKKTRKKLNTLPTVQPVFGTSLCILERRDRVIVPLFVAQCIEQVTHRPGFITTDGLYRISGSHSDVQTIKQEIDKVSSLYPVSLAGQIRGQVIVCRAWGALPNSVEHGVEAIV